MQTKKVYDILKNVIKAHTFFTVSEDFMNTFRFRLAGWSSFYMYQEIYGKLHFSAPWDFDLSQGNDPRFRNSAWDGFDAGDGYSADGLDQDNEWFKALWKNDWFKKLLAKRWYKITDTVILQVIEESLFIAQEAYVAINENFRKWQTLNWWQTYGDCLEKLLNWHANRKNWLDENFAQYL